MIRVVGALCAGILVMSTAHADERKPEPNLTIRQCRDIYGALMGLDRFKLGAARMTIAIDIAALTPVWQASEKARIGMVAEIGDGKEIKPGTPEYNAFVRRFDDDIGKACPLTLGRVKAADLKIGDGADENAIPPSTLAVLLPIIDQ